MQSIGPSSSRQPPRPNHDIQRRADPSASGSGFKRSSRAPAVLDLSSKSVANIETAPRRAEAALRGRRSTEVVFPPALTQVPSWADGGRFVKMAFPEYAGAGLEMVNRKCRAIEVGGTTVRQIGVTQGCRVSVPDPKHVDHTVEVEWYDDKGRVVLTGPPDNHSFSDRAMESDAGLVGNDTIGFADPARSHLRIQCRHIAARSDQQLSSGDSSDDDVERTNALRGAAREASRGRSRFASALSLQASHPSSLEQRFGNMLARSPHTTVVVNKSFGAWLRRQFDSMAVPRRSYLMVTPNHAMNLVLTAKPGEMGGDSYCAMLLDPNQPAHPVALVTSRLDDVVSWSLDRFIASEEMKVYWPADRLGKPRGSSLLTETGRGAHKALYEQTIVQPGSVEPPVYVFPPEAELGTAELRLFDILGRGEERLLGELAKLPSADLVRILSKSAALLTPLLFGDPRSITRRFETIRRLHAMGCLSIDQIASIVRPNGSAERRTTVAIAQARPEAIRAYRLGLQAFFTQGLLPRPTDAFATLFDAASNEAARAGLASTDARVREAAVEFEELRRLLSLNCRGSSARTTSARPTGAAQSAFSL
ncbi:MAG: ShET2 enterotoxin, N-terminal region [Rhizobacter sp.]|nr:ShET2 enterotoxin, N-terminal region [Rhizobacter sp.]